MVRPSIFHVAEDMNVLSGGVPAVVRQLSRRVSELGYDLSLAHVSGDASDLGDIATIIKCVPHGFLRAWGHSPELASCLKGSTTSRKQNYALFHIHGVWKAPQALAARYSANSSIPCLFSVHGMLEPWLWKKQGIVHRLKKTLFWSLLTKDYMSNSTALHAITPLERDHLHALLPGCKIEVIPNAIDLDVLSPSRVIARDPKFLFLGRLEPKKGIDILIRAFAHANLNSDWCLEIVGPSWSDIYVESLQRLVIDSGLSHRVHFRGPLVGLAKQALLDESWAMVTPSHSEVVGLVNLEAAAHLLPSITTFQTGLSDWQDGGGLLVSPEVDSLSQALIECSSWSVAEQYERGLASRALVERRYSWAAVMPLWEDLYSVVSG
jgi:glycosyltransferase involved in cell wall biosynthesis